MPARTRSFNSSALASRDVTVAAAAGSGAISGSGQTDNWGGAGAGTLGITVMSRTNLMVAPDSVRFKPDLSGTTFDTPAQWVHPGSGALGDNPGTAGQLADASYDARLHDILYFWDFDDPGTYQNPVNVLAHWKKKGYATGPYVAHMFTAPGTYTVTLWAIEPSSGKEALVTETVEVFDVADLYPGNQTICVNEDGDSDFSEKPNASAREWSISNFASNRAALGTNETVCFLFKTDGTYNTESIDHDDETTQDVYYGSYGSGAKPILSGPFNQFKNSGYVKGDGSRQDLRIVGMVFDGNFKPATDSWGSQAVANSLGGSATPGKLGAGDMGLFPGVGDDFFQSAAGNVNLMVSDCIIRNFYSKFLSHSGGAAGDSEFHIHFDDCLISNMRGGSYVSIYTSLNKVETSFNFTGNSYVNGPLTPGITDCSESLLRLGAFEYMYIAKNEFMQPATTNALLKVLNSNEDVTQFDLTSIETFEASGPWILGRTWNFCNNYCEGQGGIVTNNRTGKQGGAAENGIMDGNICVFGPRGQYMFQTGGQGFTVRNNFAWVANAPQLSSSDSLTWFVQVSTFTYDPDIYSTTRTTVEDGEHTWIGRPWPGMAPVRIYNNTWIVERPYASNGSTVPTTVRVDGFALGTGISYDHRQAVFEANNILHMTDGAMGVSVSGLNTTNALPFSPRYEGLTEWSYDTETLTPRVLGGTFDISSETIKLYAVGAGADLDGTAIPNVTIDEVLSLDVDWTAAASPADALRPVTGPMGAWTEDAVAA